MDDLLDTKTDHELLMTLLKEVAKASSEAQSGRNDLNKAHNRIKFCIVLINRLLERIEHESAGTSNKTNTD